MCSLTTRLANIYPIKSIFNNLIKCINFYIRQGLKCTQDELAASAFITVKLDDSMGGSPVQVLPNTRLSMSMPVDNRFCYLVMLLYTTCLNFRWPEQTNSFHFGSNIFVYFAQYIISVSYQLILEILHWYQSIWNMYTSHQNVGVCKMF